MRVFSNIEHILILLVYKIIGNSKTYEFLFYMFAKIFS